MTFDEAFNQALAEAEHGDLVHIHDSAGNVVSIIHWQGAGWYLTRLEADVWHEYRIDHLMGMMQDSDVPRYLPVI